MYMYSMIVIFCYSKMVLTTPILYCILLSLNVYPYLYISRAQFFFHDLLEYDKGLLGGFLQCHGLQSKNNKNAWLLSNCVNTIISIKLNICISHVEKSTWNLFLVWKVYLKTYQKYIVHLIYDLPIQSHNSFMDEMWKRLEKCLPGPPLILNPEPFRCYNSGGLWSLFTRNRTTGLYNIKG